MPREHPPTRASVTRGERAAPPPLTTRCHHSSRSISFSLIFERLGPFLEKGLGAPARNQSRSWGAGGTASPQGSSQGPLFA